MSGARMITCATHGTRFWRGDVVCAPDLGGCSAVYQTREEVLPHFAPPDCPCGAHLMPRTEPTGPVREGFTARAICSECFDARTGPGHASVGGSA